MGKMPSVMSPKAISQRQLVLQRQLRVELSLV